jgi:hypothetical protein
VLPVKGIPRFAILVVVIGKIEAAAVELLPKIAWIGPTSPLPVDVAFVAAVVVIDDKTLFDIAWSAELYTCASAITINAHYFFYH